MNIVVNDALVGFLVAGIVGVAVGAIAVVARTDPMPGYVDVPPSDLDPV